MKKSTDVMRWVGVTIFGIMAMYALSEKGFLGALLLFLGGALIAPIDAVIKLRRKLKLNKAVSIVLAVMLLFGGVLATPTSEMPDNNNKTNISETVSDNKSEDETDSKPSKDNTTDEGKENENSETSPKEESSDTEETDSKQETGSKTEDSASKPSSSGDGNDNAQNTSSASIPAYSGKAYVILNNNVPNFSAAELSATGYETYSNLDNLGRTQTALASVGKDTMPKANEERGSISSIKPSGWNQAKYDNVSGGWLYNRCHLIGWQLSAENANKRNLITGTKYLNISGMLPFENMVADYIKETGNHVAYRITPVYEGNNLLASGVQMEAYSVEDNGDGICFNIYCYNVQPGITINYANGSSSSSRTTNSTQSNTTSAPSATTTKPETSTNNTQQENNSQTVYTTATGKKYHSTKNCSGLSNAKAIYDSTLEDAKNQGLEPCSKCH